jgi:hypothetical protein
MKPIRFSGHAKCQLIFRGATAEEVIEAIRSSSWRPSELERLECSKEFPFNKEWNGKIYRTKRVRPIFVESEEKIIVVTVYVYYC